MKRRSFLASLTLGAMGSVLLGGCGGTAAPTPPAGTPKPESYGPPKPGSPPGINEETKQKQQNEMEKYKAKALSGQMGAPPGERSPAAGQPGGVPSATPPK